MSRIDRDIRHGFLTQGLGLGLRLATSVLLARMLGPSARGVLALALWAPSLFNAVFYFSLGESSCALLHRVPQGPRRVVGSLNTLALISIGAGTLLYVLLSPWVRVLLQGELPGALYALAYPLFPMTMLWACWSQLLLSLGDVVSVNLGRVLNQGILLAVAALGMGALGGGPGWALGAFLAGSAAELAWAAVRLGRRVPLGAAWDPELQRRQLGLASQSASAVWLTALSQRLDVMLVTWFAGAAGVGVYVVAAGLRDMALSLPEVYVRPVMSETAQSRGEPDFSRLGPPFRQAAALLAAAALGLGAALPWIVDLLYSREFAAAVLVGRWLLAGFLAAGLSNFLSAAFTGLGKPRPLILSQAAAQVVLASAAFVLGGRGAAGVAMAVSLSQWAALGVLLASAQRLHPGSLKALALGRTR